MTGVNPRYSSKIIKAGALLVDSKTFLQAYDESLSVEENLRRLRAANVFGKASRKRVAEILPIFRQRFCDEAALARPLRKLARRPAPDDVLDRVLYFHAARQDPLLCDLACGFVFERSRGSDPLIRPEEASTFIRGLLARHKQVWGVETLSRVTQGLLSTLRDFRVLTGAVRKRIAPTHLPVEAFAYVAFALWQGGASGLRLVQHADWKIFLLTPQEVERLFLEAQQHRYLTFQAAGKVVRIDFLTPTLEDLVDVLVA
jgi:hypothetical protein